VGWDKQDQYLLALTWQWICLFSWLLFKWLDSMAAIKKNRV